MENEIKNTGGKRDLTVKVKTARGRKSSSTRWLQRQLNDPFVQKAKADGYRSRAAYKLIELNDKFHFLANGQNILDLGAAPGGWTQIAVKQAGKEAKILAVDLREMEEIAGAEVMLLDFMQENAPDIIKQKLGGKTDIIISDMAPNTTGHRQTDHIRIMLLCEAAYEFSLEVLNEGGSFICKVLRGGTEQNLLKNMQKKFSKVRHAKPNSSRKDSAESYVVAMGFKGE